MKLEFFIPDKKLLKKVTIKEMLKEAIALLVLEADYNNEAQVKRTLIKNVKRNRKYA